MRISPIICFILLQLGMLFLSVPTYALNIDQIVVFGDSLSDNGNDYKLSTELRKVIPGLPVVPRLPPYYEGRFSNGRIWVELVAEKMNVPLLDYAYGGAWAESYQESGSLLPYGLGLQVGFYLSSAKSDTQRDRHLYVIWSGANDYLQGRDNVDEATTKTVAVIQEQMHRLMVAGAKNFLIVGQLDLNLVPEVLRAGPELSMNVEKLVTMHNAKLISMLENERKEHPEMKIIYQDTTDFIDEILDHPKEYRFTNVSEPCYDGPFFLASESTTTLTPKEAAAAKKAQMDIENNVTLKVATNAAAQVETNGQFCQNPEEYFFWDTVHPTYRFHIAAQQATLRTLVNNDIH